MVTTCNLRSRGELSSVRGPGGALTRQDTTYHLAAPSSGMGAIPDHSVVHVVGDGHPVLRSAARRACDHAIALPGASSRRGGPRSQKPREPADEHAVGRAPARAGLPVGRQRPCDRRGVSQGSGHNCRRPRTRRGLRLADAADRRSRCRDRRSGADARILSARPPDPRPDPRCPQSRHVMNRRGTTTFVASTRTPGQHARPRQVHKGPRDHRG